MTPIIILPYFSEEEVARYLRLADHIASLGRQSTPHRYLLAASPRIEPNARLAAAFGRLAPTDHLRCPTQIFGYPQGPTAMFWDAMEHVDRRWGHEPGFSLWMESDMVPVKPDWLDRLKREWCRPPAPLVMGCLIPPVYKRRLLRRKKLLLDQHVNGGACYAKDFARRMSAASRDVVFDMAVYSAAQQRGGVRATNQIALTTLSRARRDVVDPERVLLHGFMQDKDQFLEVCARPVSLAELRAWRWRGMSEAWETARRRVRVWLVRRGPQAMFENMLLAKRADELRRRAA
jgi:hypothetical protein